MALRSFHLAFIAGWSAVITAAPPTCTRSTPHSISGAPYCLLSADPTALCAVHDPSVIMADGSLYLFSTDTGAPRAPPHLHIRASADNGTTWATASAVFPTVPPWALVLVPNAINVWAPDISFSPTHGFSLYYSVSSFGSETSVIGLVTTPSLAHPVWTDRGLVLSSTDGDGFNAIDPAWVLDRDGSEWLVFGSFWSGIKLVALDANGKPRANAPIHSLAQRPPPDAMEGAFLVPRPDAHYLFVSWGACCRGVNSTYNVRVGRSVGGIMGPYADRDGVAMLSGGGTLLVGGGWGWAAGGGQGLLRDESSAVSHAPLSRMVLHAYDGVSGAPFLQLVDVEWGSVDGWPSVVPT